MARFVQHAFAKQWNRSCHRSLYALIYETGYSRLATSPETEERQDLECKQVNDKKTCTHIYFLHNDTAPDLWTAGTINSPFAIDHGNQLHSIIILGTSNSLREIW